MAKTSRRPPSTVVLDLNNPEFLRTFLSLDSATLHQVAQTLDRIRRMDWDTVYKAAGLKWEAVDHIPGPHGEKVYSVRLSIKVRALAYREGQFMRFLSLHPDHDSAYDR